MLILAASSVAVADIFIKKAVIVGSFSKMLVSPWIWGAIVLYLFQIGVFAYLFVSGSKLLYIGVMQIVLYSLIVILAGIFLFNESITPIQMGGVVLAIVGVILLNL